MKEKIYTAAAIAVSIIRAVIGFAVAIPAVAICAILDKFAAKLWINVDYDRDDLEVAREAVACDLCSMYRKYSDFS